MTMTSLVEFFLVSFLVCLAKCESEFPSKVLAESRNILDGIAGIVGLDNDTLLQMLDASTKIPNGLLNGNFFDLGNFEECYGLKTVNLTNNEIVYGKYCLSTTPLELLGIEIPLLGRIRLETRELAATDDGIGFHWAYCIPHTLPAENLTGDFLKFREGLCSSKATEPDFSAGAIATLVVLSILAVLVIASTLYDVYLYFNEEEASHELLLAFSALSNGKKLITFSSNPDQLLCLNGLRAISMAWVILGHGYSLSSSGPVSNLPEILDWQKDAANMVIFGTFLAVDSFLAMGGLVTVYTFMKAVDKGVQFNIILYYVHRYLRLTPALGLSVLVYTFLLKYLGNGPLWATVSTSLSDQCFNNGWWETLLYVSNYIDYAVCPSHAWYLVVDMQLFVLSPLVLLPLARWPKYTLGAMGVLAVFGVIVPFVIGYEYNLHYFATRKNDLSLNYHQTYARFGPYVIGMITGYLIYKLKKTRKPRLQPKILILLWLIVLTGLTACCIAPYPVVTSLTDYDRLGNAFLLGFNRNSWAVALCGLIYLCVAYKGPIDKFLSIPVFQFIAKISYSMYLVHYAIITIRFSSSRELMRFSNSAMMHSFWGDFMFTVVVALALCFMTESPIVIIEKHIFGGKKGKDKL